MNGGLRVVAREPNSKLVLIFEHFGLAVCTTSNQSKLNIRILNWRFLKPVVTCIATYRKFICILKGMSVLSCSILACSFGPLVTL